MHHQIIFDRVHGFLFFLLNDARAVADYATFWDLRLREHVGLLLQTKYK